MKILQINTSDIGGGAEKSALDLFQAYRARGHGSWLGVGYKYGDDPDILLVPRVSNSARCSKWARGWLAIDDKLSPLVGNVRGVWRLRSLLRRIARPRLLLETDRGYEDFDFPGSWDVLNLPGVRPDIVHCHNLHGDYFDLQALPWLSHEVPTMLTLRDAWLLSGHCAHSFGCERWKTGCGQCPDLTIYPAIRRDATAYNWQRKMGIYAESRLYIATPSQWLMHKVEQSMLAPAIVESRVIYNGMDLTALHPGIQREARAELGIPQDAKILLFAGYGTRANPFKDYVTLEAAVRQVAECLPTERIILICLGEEQPPERVGRVEVQFIGFQNNPITVSRFYQSADLYLHAANADTFPRTVLEALACGIPVIATAVGGIPEQVKDGKTGFLVPPKDADAMAKHILILLTDASLRRQFALDAAQDARERFDLNRQVDTYIEWYHSIIEKNRKH